MYYNEISDVVDTDNKSKESTSSENNSTTLVTSLQKTLNNVERESADVDSDKKTTAADYVRVKNYIMGKGKIEI